VLVAQEGARRVHRLARIPDERRRGCHGGVCDRDEGGGDKESRWNNQLILCFKAGVLYSALPKRIAENLAHRFDGGLTLPSTSNAGGGEDADR
jgi:hypothetical protein